MRSQIVTTVGVLSLVCLAAACGGSSTAPDGGRRDGGADAGTVLTPPNVTVSADPASAMSGQEVAFSAAISGGTAPYATCTWKFSATLQSEAGTLSGSTCTGRHTYPDNGDYVVVAEVIDNANRRGTGTLTYSVGGGSTGDTVNLVVREMTLVNPPANNRYRPGAELRASFKVKNFGLGVAGASVARISLRNFGGTETQLGDVNVGSVAAQGEQLVTATLTIPAGTAIGSYDLKVIADATTLVTEDSETDNIGLLLGALAIEAGGDGGN